MAEEFLKKLKKSEFNLRQVKKQTADRLQAMAYDEIIENIKKDKRHLSALLSISYDKTSEIAWRAIHLTGRAIAQIAVDDFAEARGQIQRLIWNATDESGTIPWTVPEIMGEAIRENPKPFEDIIPIIIGYSHSETEDNIFLAGVLYALGRIGEVHPQYISDYVGVLVREGLTHRDPEVVANAVIAAKRLKMTDLDLAPLLQRTEKVQVYYDDKLMTITLKQLVENG
ncbi:DVU0298 family protein [Candidatus Magnetominusculus xianensis]|uniref:HEAT repeat domain-containing protein n=1 Tax=Candidatus Magnetominusculus xianensis TaxID=1748249 RepID=A0ABR5SJ36_9BACT|nr:DVU0298 family protein [Candidatus Magnetominusculus xianensis]KWT91782.1 hypothetical protein ASN18_0772 [Candidatus Magnetominusculus xianensis]MBF0404842.1 hypothetical protein [Nitrospirota bacterium]